MSHNQRIMVVDDEPDLLRMVELYLKTWKFDVIAFGNPTDALAAFRRDPSAFSLVLTDIRMPAMTGLELAAHMLKIRPDIKIMLMTAYQVDSLGLKTVLPVIKHDDILKKPFKLREICEGVKRQLQVAY